MTLLDQLPLLVVLLPLAAAPVCMFLRRGPAAWLLTTAVSWIMLGLSLMLLVRVSELGPVAYAFGGWPPPWGIAYRVDLLSAFVLLLVTLSFAAAATFAHLSVEAEIQEDRRAPFYGALLLAAAGFVGIVLTADAFNLFVFLEIASLASYALIAMGRRRQALTAAFRYLIMGTVGATFVLVGIGFLYMMTGTLNMQDLADRLPDVASHRTVTAGLAFILVGAGLKLALFPLHHWLPGAYTHAPSIVSAFLAATATKIGVYMLLRFLLGVFDPGLYLAGPYLGTLLLVLGSAGVLFGSVTAVFQENVKSLLAWSSIAQIGYMVVAIGLATTAGITAAVLHLFNHGLMKGALFLAVGALIYRTGSARLKDLGGLARRMPWTFAALVVGGLSLIGIPGTLGFISKWALVLAAIDREMWLVVVLVPVGSLLALAYVWRLLEACGGGPAGEGADHEARCEAPPSMLVPIWTLALVNLVFGVWTAPTLGLATRISSMLAGGSLP